MELFFICIAEPNLMMNIPEGTRKITHSYLLRSTLPFLNVCSYEVGTTSVSMCKHMLKSSNTTDHWWKSLTSGGTTISENQFKLQIQPVTNIVPMMKSSNAMGHWWISPTSWSTTISGNQFKLKIQPITNILICIMEFIQYQVWSKSLISVGILILVSWQIFEAIINFGDLIFMAYKYEGLKSIQ